MNSENGVITLPLVDAALANKVQGLSVLATRSDKTPVCSWRQFQSTIATEEMIASMFGDPDIATGIGVICGAVSGNLECIDFDDGGSAFQPWFEMVTDQAPELAASLVITRTPSGGNHVIYRCPTMVIPGNQRLAIKMNGSVLIETRGEGGYFCAPPSPGYEFVQGPLVPAEITPAERQLLHRAAYVFNEKPAAKQLPKVNVDGSRPGDEFNRRCGRDELRGLLENHGWRFWRQTGENECWTRPGKEKGISATIRTIDGIDVFYVFTSSTSFDPGCGYTPFQVYAKLHHGDDFSGAAKDLKGRGYGTTVDSVDTMCRADGSLKIVSTWMMENIQKPETIISGLIGRGDKLQIVGPSKVRKSWFTEQLALSLAAGKDFLAFPIPNPVRVAVCQFEIREPYYFYRVRGMCEGLGIDPISLNNMAVANLRGRQFEEVWAEVQNFRPEIVFLDPLYKLYQPGHDENSAGDQAALLAKFDKWANTLDAAIVYVHHDNKSGPAGNTGTVNRGSGSGVTGRDFDAGFFLAPHAANEDSIVIETICRNYPPHDDIVAGWAGRHFVLLQGVPAIPETPDTKRQKNKRGINEVDIVGSVASWFIDGKPIGAKELQNRIMSEFVCGRDKAYSAIAILKETKGFVQRRIDGNSGVYMIYPP